MVVLILSFVLTFWYGIETARTRPFVESEGKGFDDYWTNIHEDAYAKHRLYRYVHLWSLLAAILIIESMVRIAGVSPELTPIKVIHYVLDATYMTLLVLTMWYNGFKSEHHGKYAHWLSVTGIGVLVTGVYLYVGFLLKH